MTEENSLPEQKVERVKCVKRETSGKGSRTYVNEKYLHILGWILLTVVICTFITTFYLAITWQSKQDKEDNITLDKQVDDGNYSNGFIKVPLLMDFDKYSRTSFSSALFGAIDMKTKGCVNEDCKIMCSDTINIYSALYKKLHMSSCRIIGVVVIDNQGFPNGLIQNNWLAINRTVSELMITESNVTKIKNETFNVNLFSNILAMVWRKLNQPQIESGALVGLNKLKYLTIDTKLPMLEQAFFKPVQTTLTYLKLNAGLVLGRNYNLFGSSFLSKLEYLDLSYNSFAGPLTQYIFQGTPHLKYLHLSHASLLAIENDAFKYLTHLNVLNLSHNSLKTLNSAVFVTLFRHDLSAFISLEPNNWHCDCDIRELAQIYREHHKQFMDALYCKSPNGTYGKFIDKLNLKKEDCDMSNVAATTTYNNFPEEVYHREQKSANENVTIYKMRCANSYDTSMNGLETVKSPEIFRSNDLNLFEDEQGLAENEQNKLEYLQFEPAVYDFELILLPNRSVKVVVEEFDEDSNPLNIIWFSKQLKDYDSGKAVGYNCFSYVQPFLLVTGLTANTTYTFCLIPYNEYAITPFNCLPLYVPRVSLEEDNIWISSDNKDFTVGMLCLIFMLSSFFGAVVAYFGLKAYPDMLEGSKNVLVVKKPEKTCYVSTIPVKEKSSDTTITKYSTNYSSSETPTISAPPPPSLYTAQTKALQPFANLQANSALFEDSFVSVSFDNDEYEMPKNFDLDQKKADSCVPNAYASSPCSPPPLPKRNSAHLADLVVNRFSKTI